MLNGLGLVKSGRNRLILAALLVFVFVSYLLFVALDSSTGRWQLDYAGPRQVFFQLITMFILFNLDVLIFFL